MNTQNEKPDTSWEHATLANRFMFYKIFTSYPDLCKHLLEILLNKEIDRIEPPNGEQSFDTDYDAKSIRLDVYTKDSDSAYDLEMQAVDTLELPKRARYYQGLMDVDSLKKGDTFSRLKDNYVIFICLDDIFGRSLPVYSFKNTCEEEPALSLNDRTFKIFFNAQKYDKMPGEELRNFFSYLNNGKAASEFEKRIEQHITEARHNAEWRRKYMTWEQEVNLKYEQGLQQGTAKTKLEDAANFYRKGVSKEIILECTGLEEKQFDELIANISNE